MTLASWTLGNIIFHLLPRILSISFSVNWDKSLFRNSTLANWAKQSLFRLVHPLEYADPAVQMPARRDHRFIRDLEANVAFELRTTAPCLLLRGGCPLLRIILPRFRLLFDLLVSLLALCGSILDQPFPTRINRTILTASIHL